MAVGYILYNNLRMLCRRKCMPTWVRTLSTTPRVTKSHYDVLEITQKATQNDIKTAYYKLSKVYHPDKSKDEESAKKFRAIAEAYEVLGNVKLKKMYDKGLIVGQENTSRMEYEPEPEPADPTLKFYKSRGYRHVAPTMDGRKPIYDFDTWSKQHYGELFNKSQYQKDFIKKKNQKQVERVAALRQEALIFIIFVLGGLFIVLVVRGTDNYDYDYVIADNKKQSEKQEEQNTNNLESIQQVAEPALVKKRSVIQTQNS